MKRLLLLWMAFALRLSLLAAPLPEAEQMLGRFEQATGDVRVEAANAFMNALLQEGVADEALTFSSGVSEDSLSMLVWYWAGEYWYSRQQYALALEFGKKAIALLQKKGDLLTQSDCLSLLGTTCFRLSDYVNAARYMKACYEIDKKTGDRGRESSSLNTIAGIYLAARQPEEAEKYILKAIEVNQMVDEPKRMAVLLGMASEIYGNMNNHKKALDYARQAYEKEQQLGSEVKAAVRLSQMASAYIGLEQFDKAVEVLERAIPVLRKNNNLQSLGISCNLMGKVKLHDDEEDKAAEYFREGVKIFQQLGDLYNEIHSQEGLYEALKYSFPVEAMRHHERLIALKDSLYNLETTTQLSKYNAEYGNDLLQEKTLRSERLVRLTLLIGSALLLLVLGVVTWVALAARRRNRQQMNRYDELQEDLGVLNAKYELMRNRYSNAMATRTQDGNEEDGTLPAAERAFLDKTSRVVERQVEIGKFDVDTVASEMNMSTSQFRRRLSAVTGISPQLFIQNIRLKKARYLLDNHPELNINEIAMKCGYDESSNFTHVFKRVFGITPSDYLNGRLLEDEDETMKKDNGSCKKNE